jgi:hypothetical protein
MLSRHVIPHTWMLFPAGWRRHGDYPDIAASAAPAPLLVQYASGDAMFPEAGMRAADAVIRRYYDKVDAPDAYRGIFYDGPHRFDVAMQDEAFVWLRDNLN